MPYAFITLELFNSIPLLLPPQINLGKLCAVDLFPTLCHGTYVTQVLQHEGIMMFLSRMQTTGEPGGACGGGLKYVACVLFLSSPLKHHGAIS